MKIRNPSLKLEITKENYQNAVKASSAACVVADDIKRRYPQFSRVKVNIATIQVTDRKRGVRYVYLTPSGVGELVLAFDQGWPEETFPRKFIVKRPVKVIPITRSASMVKIDAQRRAARIVELEQKKEGGQELTSVESRALSRLQNPKPQLPRPANYGPSTVEMTGGNVVTIGGKPPKPPKKFEKYHANLLHERDRHFGAKLARPSEAFEQAVKQAVKVERSKRKKKN